jgi:hypothetical protein
MSRILYSIIDDLLVREDKGLKEYGTTMDRTDLSEQDWLQHAYEEALDLAIYLKKIIKTKQNTK